MSPQRQRDRERQRETETETERDRERERDFVWQELTFTFCWYSHQEHNELLYLAYSLVNAESVVTF